MIVTLPPELTIARVAACKAELASALREGGEIRLDARAVGDVDVAGLQLLVAAQKSAAAARVPFGFLPGGRSPALDRAAVSAGLVRGTGAPEERFWKEP